MAATPRQPPNQAQRIVALTLAVSGVGFLIAGLYLTATVGIEWAVLIVVGLADFVYAGLYASGRIGGSPAGSRRGSAASLGDALSRRGEERGPEARGDGGDAETDSGLDRGTGDADSRRADAEDLDRRAGVDPDYNPYARED